MSFRSSRIQTIKLARLVAKERRFATNQTGAADFLESWWHTNKEMDTASRTRICPARAAQYVRMSTDIIRLRERFDVCAEDRCLSLAADSSSQAKNRWKSRTSQQI
jgi:hypothetical protein